MDRELKRQQRTVGAIVEIPLNNDFKTYAYILDEYFAFYNIYTKVQPDIETIIASDILFFSAVYDTAITKGHWIKIGKKLPVNDSLLQLPIFYTQDFLKPENYTIYKDGKQISATKKECIGIEYLSVWTAENMEQRLNDHFLGNTNQKVERMKNAEMYSEITPPND